MVRCVLLAREGYCSLATIAKPQARDYVGLGSVLVEDRMLRVREVVASVSRVSGHPVDDVLSRRDLAVYRQVVAFIVHKCGRSLSDIGRALHNDHKTIAHSVHRITSRLEREDFCIFIERVLSDLEVQGCNISGARRALSAKDHESTATMCVASRAAELAPKSVAMSGWERKRSIR